MPLTHVFHCIGESATLVAHKHSQGTLEGLKMLKPSRPVLISMPGICGCQCASFISPCACMQRGCEAHM